MNTRRWMQVFVCVSLLTAVAGCDDKGGGGGGSDAGSTVADAGAPLADAGQEEQGFFAFGEWTIRGAAPTAASCAAEGIDRVRLVLFAEDDTIAQETVAPCAAGELRGAAKIPWGVTYYGAWYAQGASDRVRQRVLAPLPIHVGWPTTEMRVLPADFEPLPLAAGDWQLRSLVTMQSAMPLPPDGTTHCEATHVARVRLTLTPQSADAPVVTEAACMDATADIRTARALKWGVRYMPRWELLSQSGEVLDMKVDRNIIAVEPTTAVYGLNARFTR